MEHYLRSLNVLTDDEITSALKCGHFRSLKRGEFLITAGKVCHEVAFVQAGNLRTFHYNSEGAEVSWCFTFPGNFVTAYSSFINQTKTSENIEALTDVDLYCIHRDTITALEKSSTNWLRLTKKMAEQEFTKLEERVLLLLTEDARSRYDNMMARHPEYLRNIPLNHLASYLGVTQRHLSRIRKGAQN